MGDGANDIAKKQHFPKNPRGLEDNFHHEFLRVQIFDALELQNHTLPEPRQRMGTTSTKKRGDHREWPNKIMCVDLCIYIYILDNYIQYIYIYKYLKREREFHDFNAVFYSRDSQQKSIEKSPS